MTSTGKKARRTYGTRFAAKRAKERRAHKFHPTPERKVCDYPTGEKAIELARRMGLLPAKRSS